MSEAAGELQLRAQQTADYEIVVIGAGQAGLTIGYYLAQQGRRFVVLERSDHGLHGRGCAEHAETDRHRLDPSPRADDRGVD